MEIVIENPSLDGSTMMTSPVNTGFASHPGHHRPYRAAYVSNGDGTPPSVEYYGTLQAPRPRSRLISPEPDFETSTPQIPTTVRRVDRSGLLEIAELEPPRNCSRGRHLNGADNNGHSGTLTRRIDRSGLLEAVPEVPDQCQGWRSPEKTAALSTEDIRGKSMIDRQLTGAEIEKQEDSQQPQSQQQNLAHRQQATSPRNSRSPIDPASQSCNRRSSETLASQEECRIVGPSPTSVQGLIGNPVTLSTSVSSPYLRRYPGGSPTSNLERPTPIVIGGSSVNCDETRNKNRNSFTCASSPVTTKFLPIDGLSSRNRQSYVDLTGASYTRSSSVSPHTISRNIVDSVHTNISDSDNIRDKRKQPDCLGRLSPRLRNDGSSPLTMSAIPDVIEAHGSRSHPRDNERDGKDDPESERAEAEGCEHTAGETLEETRVSFKPSNKILHNDNIQTLRVIILSEQL